MGGSGATDLGKKDVIGGVARELFVRLGTVRFGKYYVEPGNGDRNVQAYTYRSFLSDLKEDQVPFLKPDRQDPGRYKLLRRYLAARSCRWQTLRRAIGRKHDVLVADYHWSVPVKRKRRGRRPCELAKRTSPLLRARLHNDFQFACNFLGKHIVFGGV